MLNISQGNCPRMVLPALLTEHISNNKLFERSCTILLSLSVQLLLDSRSPMLTSVNFCQHHVTSVISCQLIPTDVLQTCVAVRWIIVIILTTSSCLRHHPVCNFSFNLLLKLIYFFYLRFFSVWCKLKDGTQYYLLIWIFSSLDSKTRGR